MPINRPACRCAYARVLRAYICTCARDIVVEVAVDLIRDERARFRRNVKCIFEENLIAGIVGAYNRRDI